MILNPFSVLFFLEYFLIINGMLRKIFQHFVLLMLVGVGTASALPLNLPGAGELQQKIENDRARSAIPKILPEQSKAPDLKEDKQGIQIVVKSFSIVGNTLIPTNQIQPLLAKWLDVPINFSDLELAAAEVAKIYRRQGWIVRTSLPEQDMVDGVVTIEVIEASMGKVNMDEQNHRVSNARVLNIISRQQKPNMPLNAKNLDRALLLANDLPGVKVTGSLAPGRQTAETDLNLLVEDESLLSGNVLLDNNGPRVTGSDRASVNLNFNSPLKIGDLLSLSAIHSRGSDYARIDYSIPVGFDGLRIGVNRSFLSYDLVAPEFASLNAYGFSDSSGLSLVYPVIRSKVKNLYLLVNYDHRTFDNRAIGQTQTDYKVDDWSFALAGNSFDQLYGGGANYFGVNYVNGRLDLDGSPNKFADANSTKAHGQFNKLKYNLSRQQVITDNLFISASLNGQFADENLDSSEKFYLGGANGVRAYPVNEGGGSSGHLANLEAYYRLPKGFSLIGFYDIGTVKINEHNGYVGAPELNRYSLKGAGLGVEWQSSFGLSLKATWAHRIGDNPNPNGKYDQDGSLDKNRVWLTGALQF